MGGEDVYVLSYRACAAISNARYGEVFGYLPINAKRKNGRIFREEASSKGFPFRGSAPRNISSILALTRLLTRLKSAESSLRLLRSPLPGMCGQPPSAVPAAKLDGAGNSMPLPASCFGCAGEPG